MYTVANEGTGRHPFDNKDLTNYYNKYIFWGAHTLLENNLKRLRGLKIEDSVSYMSVIFRIWSMPEYADGQEEASNLARDLYTAQTFNLTFFI